ncbi:GntR family transcriptional regulator [Streptomyces sp. NPDC059385]|uniref:GntR family transcriptional regulator n=1 Tax=Streptomyces sp. NPDC059385 TaxID=3346817 RepID=UPI003697EDC0
MTQAPQGRTALYRHFAADGTLLYVGISHDPDARFEVHLGCTKWASLSVRRTDKWYPTRKAALLAETAAIRTEQPQANYQHNWVRAPIDLSIWPSLADMRSGKWEALVGLMEREIAAQRWLPGMKLPSQQALASAVDLGIGCAIRATRHLWLSGVLTKRRGGGFFVR